MKTKSNHKCFVGFDGYVDTLCSVVKKRESAECYEAYNTIAQFGERILASAGKSADIEIIPKSTKLGGNGPILANALATLGFETTCMGQLETQSVCNPFNGMHPNCTNISIGQASITTALEFSDGKIMLGNLKDNTITWEQLKLRAGTERLKHEIAGSSLLCLVNWSGLYRMNEILEGLLQEILIPLHSERSFYPHIFLDLSDPTARSEADIRELFGLIQQMAARFHVTLGMNENEARKFGAFFCSDPSLEEIGRQTRNSLGIFQLVIHTNRRVYGFRQDEEAAYSGMHVVHPVQATGAGDHFNAGFCAGLLENKSLQGCLVLGQAMASYYVARGATASHEELNAFMEHGGK